MSGHDFPFVSADAAPIGDLAWQVRREGADVPIPNCDDRDGVGERWSDGDGDRPTAWGYTGV